MLRTPVRAGGQRWKEKVEHFQEDVFPPQPITKKKAKDEYPPSNRSRDLATLDRVTVPIASSEMSELQDKINELNSHTSVLQEKITELESSLNLKNQQSQSSKQPLTLRLDFFSF